MNLIYIYFKYRDNSKSVFRDDIELNFDSRHHFSLDGKRLKLTSKEDAIPNHFFSVLSERADNPTVDNVSVVVGGNGAGKTSLVKVISDLQNETTKLSGFEKYVIVYLKHGDESFQCETNIKGIIFPEGVVLVDRNVFDNRSFNRLPMVYITPHFTPYQVLGHNPYSTFSDLSVFGAMMSDVEQYYNPTSSEHYKIASLNPIPVYQTKQTKHMLSFVSGEAQLPQQLKFPIGDGEDSPSCEPKGFSVSISNVAYQKRKADDVDGKVKQILNKIDGGAGEFVANVFYAYAGLHLIDMPIKTFAEIAGKNEDAAVVQEKKDAWDRFQAYSIALRDFCLQQSRITINDIRSFFKKDFPDDPEVASAKQLFDALADLVNCVRGHDDLLNAIPVGSPDNRRIITANHTSEYLQKVLNLVDLHFKTQRILSFLDFDTVPRMSSGERSFFDTWGRLYHHYRESTDFCNKNREIAFDSLRSETWQPEKDAIVFLDEVETTMHPEWQRQLVKRTIWFFEAFVPWVHPHLIFATHSPVLLSDIPSGNVVRLRRNQNDKSEVVPNEDKSNTFAANIFDLYRDSFFLNNGPIGAFAVSKVNGLLDKLNPKRKEKETVEEYKKRVNDSWTTIDENDLKVARLIGDPFLSRYVYRRFETLGRRDDGYDFPEDE